jgi:hypothetical protein
MMKRVGFIPRSMGILYLAGTAAGILSRVLTAPLVHNDATPGFIASNGGQITLAAMLVMTMGLALALIPVVAFPALKQHDETLALGYVVFRGALEGAAYLGIVVSWLLVLPLSRAYQAGMVDTATLLASARFLLEGRELGAVLMVVFSLGGFLFYALLFRARLVPRWLSGWGLLALLLNFAAGMLAMFGVLSPISTASTLMQLPIFFQEIVLAVWLIVKGFNLLEEMK